MSFLIYSASETGTSWPDAFALTIFFICLAVVAIVRIRTK
jgi:hypothetical protein